MKSFAKIEKIAQLFPFPSYLTSYLSSSVLALFTVSPNKAAINAAPKKAPT